MPTIVFKKVEKTILNDELIESLTRQNDINLMEDSSMRPRIVYRTRSKTNYNDAVISVPPKMYSQLLSLGKVFLGYSAVKVEPFTLVTQCYKCMGYGHTRKYCNSNEQLCGHCAGFHDYKDCLAKESIPKCVNCQHSELVRDKNIIPHTAISELCPLRQIIMRRIEDRTDYGN